MNHDLKMLLFFYRELVRAEYEGCASFSERMDIADRVESRPTLTPAQREEMEKIAAKWAWSLGEACNAALAANAKADGETFLQAVRAIQKATIKVAEQRLLGEG